MNFDIYKRCTKQISEYRTTFRKIFSIETFVVSAVDMNNFLIGSKGQEKRGCLLVEEGVYLRRLGFTERVEK